MAKLSYTPGSGGGVEVKHYWPTSRNEARDLVRRIFEKNKWDERSQLVYMANKGIEPKPVEELSVEELRTLVTSFRVNRMAIFFDAPGQEE